MTINPADRDFIESHKVYFEQARMKFLHGFAPGTMDRFYEIYKRHINPGYVLTPWCSECVIDMVARLGTWYAQMQDDELLAVQAGARIVASWGIPLPVEAELVEVKSASLWPEAIDTAPVIIDEEKSAGHSLDAPEKRGKGRPKKKK